MEYWASRDGEIYNDGPYPSRRAACEANAKFGQVTSWWVGESQKVTAEELWFVDAEDVIEKVALNASDNIGEVAEDYGIFPEPIVQALQDHLDEAVRAFLAAHRDDVEPQFFRIINPVQYPVKGGTECPCIGWCDQDPMFRIMTGHHDRCSNAPKEVEF